MSAAARAYLASAAAMLLSRLLGVAAGFASLWLLTRLLDKPLFGTYAFVSTAVQLLAFFAALGLDRTVIYRLAAERGPAGTLQGGRFVARCLLRVLPAAIGISALLALGAGWMTSDGELPELPFFLTWQGLALAPMAAMLVFEAWLRSQRRVPASILTPMTGDLARVGLLALALYFATGIGGVVAAYGFSALVPLLTVWGLVRGRVTASGPEFGASDVRYGLGMLVTRLSNQGLRRADLLLLGALAGGLATADYAVAARIAAFVDLGREALKPTFTPRARWHLSNGDSRQLAREYRQSRFAAWVVALTVSAVLAAIGDLVLGWFGDYGGAYPVLLVLASGYVLNAGFGMHSAYLAMLGAAGWSAGLRSATLAVSVLASVLLIPGYGALGAALGVGIGTAFANCSGSIILYRLNGFATLGWSRGLLLLLSCAVPLVGAAGALGPIETSAGLLLCLGALLGIDRGFVADALARWSQRVEEPE